MSADTGQRSRPTGNRAASRITGGRSDSSLLDSATVGALVLRHEYAIVVRSERRDGVMVEQVMTNLPAAERKVHRTRERGLSAGMTLVRLVPVASATMSLEALIGGEVR